MKNRARTKILYVCGTANIGGAEVSLTGLLKRMNGDMYRAVAVVPSPGPLADRLKKIGVEVRYCPLMEFSKRRAASFFMGVLKLARLIRREEIDLVHANSIYISEESLFSARKEGVPCVCHIRDLTPVLGAGRIRAIAFKKMDRLIAISEAVKRDMTQKLGIPEGKIARIYNGVDTGEFNPGISGNDFRREFNLGSFKLVGMAGRFSPEKGHEIFLRAAKEVMRELDDVYFIVAGGSDLGSQAFRQSMERLSADLGLNDRVIFTGFRDDISRVLAALDIVVVPSDAEPFGRVIIEAMSMERPVIATASGGAPEILSKECGILIEPRDVAQLKKAIVRLIKNPQLANDMGREGRKAALSRFSANEHAREIEKLYNGILHICAI